ncbi:hypothetical protein [Mycolicibacterium mageritense]|uniref:hypothetical protein n=2 Tax=Mycolicibacterium mageritense TaxID=53462 RepID=UPI0010399BD5|nr:hypothetical protein [Mycolicibacterium mageritense]MCC9182242.1 hypothetical protein [Mycolicibacterium mageritense]
MRELAPLMESESLWIDIVAGKSKGTKESVATNHVWGWFRNGERRPNSSRHVAIWQAASGSCEFSVNTLRVNAIRV